jgi:tyrosinase
MFERHDVWDLSKADPWHPVIEWYARAINELKRRGAADPSSWSYLAAIHGTDLPRSRWPRGATWSECQHNSWFFLPWHRIYLYYFERTLRQTIVALGGPNDWALPYWDYSDSSRPDVRKLPPAFTQQRMPSGDPNPLFVSQRLRSMNQGGELDRDAVEIDDAMAETDFTGPASARIAGFGGPVTGWNHRGGTVGSLENTPHGDVHMGVGGARPLGLMSSFETAGLDPVFWLHHANIDRLWEVWLGQGGLRANPTATSWLGMRFRIGSGPLALTLTVRDVIDTSKPPLAYKYSRVSPPAPSRRVLASRAEGGPEVVQEESLMPEDRFPEMVGASEERVPLTSATTEVGVKIDRPTGPALESVGGAESVEPPRKVYLKIENVKGRELSAPSYRVYVNLPPGADPAADPGAYEDRRIGKVSMFGVVEASQGNEEHGGSGLTFSFDITGVAQRLQQAGDWDPEHLRVTFTPTGNEPVPEGLEGDVTAGRVSLFYA